MGARHVVDLLDDTSATLGNSPAICDSTDEWTFTELVTFSKKFAEWLARNGVIAGDRVVLRIAPSCAFGAIVYGCFRVGAILVPVNHSAKLYQLDSIVEDAKAKFVITDETIDGRPAYIGLETLWPEVRELREIASDLQLQPSDIALLMYTSGSTSKPKGVICPHGAVMFAVLAIASAVSYSSEDVVGCRLSLAFDYGLYQLFLCSLSGAQLVLISPNDDLRFTSALARRGVTVVPLVPSLAALVLATAERVQMPNAIRLFTNTGEAMSAKTLNSLRETFPAARIQLMYGITECKRVSIMAPDGDLVRHGSVGQPLPGTVVRIVDSDGMNVGAGEIGEIVVSGPHVMAGYWADSDLTGIYFKRAELDGAIELHTGDYGHLDDDGYLYFRGRSRDFFKRHGIRISAAEIEHAATQIPGVSAAVLIPTTERSDMLLCVISEIAPERVLLKLSQLLDPQRVPKSCRVMQEFPLNVNGKIDRTLLATLVGEIEGNAN